MIRVARTQLTRNEIIRLAANSFAQDGYTKTSIHGLCKRLNMSTGNLTFYFPTREHLLAELVDMLCEFQRKQMEEEEAEDSEGSGNGLPGNRSASAEGFQSVCGP